MSIEAWVTGPAGASDYRAHLDRSPESPYRRFAVSRTRGADPGVGSLEYNLDNEIIRQQPNLLADDNLVWMRYRGRTMVWVIEERQIVLAENEGESDWVKVSGRGVKVLLGDRIVWPSRFDETHLNPANWSAGDWKTKLDGAAAGGQKVVPVTTTVGAIVGDPVELVSSTGTEVGIIASINAGVSVTLVDNLSGSFATGDRIYGAARQWRRFVNRAAGEMLWDLINESNPRFTYQIARGTIETDGDDGWTQDLRFDNLLDVVTEVVETYGDIDMDGLTFSYLSDPGENLRNTVIFEEGADVLKVERASSVREKVSWVLAEGLGEGVTAKLRFSVGGSGTRRREAYTEAKDVNTTEQLMTRARTVRLENAGVDSIAIDVTEDRFRVFDDYDLYDTVRVIAPSRSINETLAIVAIYLAETDDEQVKVSIDVNDPRLERDVKLFEKGESTKRSLGVRNRQPQGQLVPYSFSGQGILDSGSPLYVFVKIPDRVYLVIEASVTLAFRQFLAPATAASSGGGATSGSGGGVTSGNGTAHDHSFATDGGAAGPGGASHIFALTASGIGFYTSVLAGGNWVTGPEQSGHNHSVPAHTHSTPAHTHALDYGTFEETYPASHSVTLRVYERTGSTWTLRGTFSGLTADLEDVDLTAVMTGPGDWRLTIQSAGGQPQGGRLGCDVFGAVLGPIQSS